MKNSSSSFYCPNCPASFYTKFLLISHQKHDHSDIHQLTPKSSPGLPIFEMEVEALEFASSSSEISEGPLDLKSSRREPKAEPSANFLDHVTTRLARDKRKVSYSCNFCGQDLQNMSKVKEHIPHHIDHLNFSCDRPTCPKSFSSLYDQLRHQERHVRKELNRRKKLRTLSPPMLINQSSSSSGGPEDHDDPKDFYLTRYCLCNQIAYGDMIACDRKDCPMEWFHFSCVGLKSKAPRGTWHCPPCKARRKKLTSRSNSTSPINLDKSR